MNSKDLIRWLIRILLNASKKCNIFNVGSDEVITIENLANKIGKKFNKNIQNSSDLKKNKLKIVDFYVPSIAKAKKILKLEIRYKLKQSLSSLLAD
jgi:nucleoside-diphosphate-sugar epimerase